MTGNEPDAKAILPKRGASKQIPISKRMLRKIYSLLVIAFGGVFLIFALFSFLIDYLHWSNAAAFFSIGIIIFVIGLLLKVAEPDR